MIKRTRLAAMVLLVSGMWAVCPLLAAGDAEHGGEGPNLFTGDLGNIFWSLVTFFAVLFVLGKFAWKPILGALQQREEFIRSSLEQAKQDREAAESRLKDYEAKLASARQEATEIVQEGRRDAEAVKRKIEQDTKESTAAMLERVKREISIATDTAIKELYDVTGTLATSIASRIISKELDARDHERLIAESIRELSATSGNGRSGG